MRLIGVGILYPGLRAASVVLPLELLLRVSRRLGPWVEVSVGLDVPSAFRSGDGLIGIS